MEIGCVVKSLAGRDKNRFYVVTGFTNDAAFIADGKVRKLEKPKQKNVRHLQKTNTVFSPDDYRSNQSIRRSLSRFNREEETIAQ